MKLLYMVNEPFDGYQVGYREALNNIVKNGILEDYLTFSFIPIEKELGDWGKTLQKLYRLFVDYKPDLLLISHIGNRNIPIEFISKLKQMNSSPLVIGYDERDVYGYIKKPLPRAVLYIAKQSDIVFLVTSGQFADRFRKIECKNVQYLPHSVSTYQFDKTWEPDLVREFDVVFIGNNSPSRIPFRRMPGVHERQDLALMLHKKFGDRFGLFGRGWDNFPCNHGPIPYNEQVEIMRKSWISIGYDHFSDYEYYFSDRLPIALISRVAHVTKQSKGLENYFTNYEHCVFYDTIEEGVDACERLLSWPKMKLIDLGHRGYEWVMQNYTEDIRMSKIISQMKIILDHANDFYKEE